MRSGESERSSAVEALSSPSEMVSPAKRLDELGLTARKSLGQHFLHDRNVVARICDAADLLPDETVVEVGPGLGILTEALAARVDRVVAIEKDADLAARLPEVLPPNAEVHALDAMDVDPEELLDGGDYKFVSNLPYNVGTAILRKFLECRSRPGSCTFMIQREVAERIVARPPQMSILAVAMQFHGAPSIAFHVGRGAFTPPPRVASSIVHMPVRNRDAFSDQDIKSLFRLVRAGFSARRKTVRNSLINGGIEPDSVELLLGEAGIDPTIRPQELDVGDWLRMYHPNRKSQA